MRTTDGQVRKLMEEMSKHGRVGLAAMRAGIDRKTARKYAKAGKLPSELVAPRTWRTRPDPFAEDWPALAGRLEAEPGLEAKTLFERLCEEHPGRYEPGQLRTLQRTIGARTRSLAATTAAAAQTVAQLEQLRGDRVDYISSLESRRSYDASQIAQLTAESQAAVVRSQALATQRATTMAASLPSPGSEPAATADPAPAAASAPTVVAGGGRTLTVVATGYDLPGHTSTGLPVGWGIAAVDPSVIPLGTRIVVPGYGVAVAADTGGAIVGDTVDLWFPSAAQAYAWGRRTVTISVGG